MFERHIQHIEKQRLRFYLSVLIPAMLCLAACGPVSADTPPVIPTPTPIAGIQCGDIELPKTIIKTKSVFYVLYEEHQLTSDEPLEVLDIIRRYYGCDVIMYPSTDGFAPADEPYNFNIATQP